MAKTRAQTNTLIKKCAILRAQGRTWKQVSKAVKVPENTLRHLPGNHHDEWHAEYLAAESQAVEAAAAKAAEYQEWLIDRGRRKGAKAEDRRLAQSAAHSLMAHRAKFLIGRHEVTGPDGGALRMTLAGLVEAAEKGNGEEKK